MCETNVVFFFPNPTFPLTVEEDAEKDEDEKAVEEKLRVLRYVSGGAGETEP